MDLRNLIESIGYLGITAIVFAESGLFLGAFLPGDSLLFTAGFLASQGILDIRILIPLCFIAAVMGDSFGYTFGRQVGPKLFKREDSLLFHRDHLVRAQRFYEKHGGKTIIIARFMPIVRTFAPILAGVGRMHYPRFLAFNVIGAFLWAVGLSSAGYILGQSVPGVDRYLLPIILAIILTSVAPTAIHILRDRAYRRSLIEAFKKFVAQTRSKRHPPLSASWRISPRSAGETNSQSPLRIAIPQSYHNINVTSLNYVIPMSKYSEESGMQFIARFRDRPWFQTQVPLRLKTTYRLGGPADFFLTPKTLEETREVLRACNALNIPLFILGGGANILFSDSGWRGAVLQPNNSTFTILSRSEPARTSTRTGAMSHDSEERRLTVEKPSAASPSMVPPIVSGDRAGEAERERSLERSTRVFPTDNQSGTTRWEMTNHTRPTPPRKPEVPLGLPLIEVKVGAGASLQQLIIHTHQQKLIGLESFFGIPARVGGALRNNVHGGPDNFDRYVKEATLINCSTGAIEIWPKKKFQFSYDRSALQHTRDWLVWDLTLFLTQADDALWRQFDAFFKSWQTYKSQTQTAAGTAGCVYKNIDPSVARAHMVPISAGALIDSLFGLNSGLRTAKISMLHGNFFQNQISPPLEGGAGEVSAGSSADMLSLINFIRETVRERAGIKLELEIELAGF